MFFSLLKLDFVNAFSYNPLLFTLLPFFLTYYIYSNYTYLFQIENRIKKNIPTFVVPTLLVITILYGVLRNLPMFSFLAP